MRRPATCSAAVWPPPPARGGWREPCAPSAPHRGAAPPQVSHGPGPGSVSPGTAVGGPAGPCRCGRPESGVGGAGACSVRAAGMVPAAGFLPPAGRGASSRRLCGPAERRPGPEPPPRGAGDREGRPRWGTGGFSRLQLARGLSPPVRRAEGSRSVVAAALGAAGRGGNLTKKPRFWRRNGRGVAALPSVHRRAGLLRSTASRLGGGLWVGNGRGGWNGARAVQAQIGSREREGELPLFGKP